MFGVTATEVLADDGVAVGPEAGEVGGHLDGTLGGGEQVEEKRHAAFGQARGGLEAEDLLDTDGDVGLFTVVTHLHLGTARDGEACWGLGIEFALRVAALSQETAEGIEE